jgi:hypothetical protein
LTDNSQFGYETSNMCTKLSSFVCSSFSDNEQISVETRFDNNQFGYETSQGENVSVCSSLTQNNQIFVETISDINQIDGAAYSVHSGSVNFEQMNGRRASICQLDGNQTMNSDVDNQYQIFQ